MFGVDGCCSLRKHTMMKHLSDLSYKLEVSFFFFTLWWFPACIKYILLTFSPQSSHMPAPAITLLACCPHPAFLPCCLWMHWMCPGLSRWAWFRVSPKSMRTQQWLPLARPQQPSLGRARALSPPPSVTECGYMQSRACSLWVHGHDGPTIPWDNVTVLLLMI